MPYKFLHDVTKGLRNRHFLIIDFVILALTPFLALYLRLDANLDLVLYGKGLVEATILFLSIKLFVFYIFGLYRRFWNSASIDEMARLYVIGTVAVTIQSIVYLNLRQIGFLDLAGLPLSITLIDGIIAVSLISTLRFSIRLFERANERFKKGSKGNNVIVIGAGQAGIAIVQEMQRNPQIGLIPVAFADDDRLKKNMRIRGVQVLGTTSSIPDIVKITNAKKAIIAMPTASGKVIRKIAMLCEKSDVETLTVPGIFEILNGKVNINTIRKIQVEDLLRRDPIKTDVIAVNRSLKNRRILITGAGGSIGSELSRQILKSEPKEIILLGHGENSIFDIENELRRRAVANNIKTKLTSKIADLRFKDRLSAVFNEYRPEIVFHAAAHKHVPLMEANPAEAVSNNIIGTRNLVELSIEFETDSFTYISTDKAVNPTNVMGATKRVAEMIVLDAAKRTGRKFGAVRFGNVLGSRGSVLHTFKRQIASGGPVTITHPDIIRYFMTIPEAVQLVLQASTLGNGGEIFMLDMGDPVKISDLAKDVIKLSGFTESEIKIEYSGLRPGEKLYEELFIKGESYEKTYHEKILIAANASNFICEDLNFNIDDLSFELSFQNNYTIKHKLKNIIPEYDPQDFPVKGSPQYLELLKGK